MLKAAMTTFPTTRVVCRKRLISRAAWAAMLLLHVVLIPAAVSKLVSATDVSDVVNGFGRIAALGLSIAFFALKTAGVPWLRLQSGWRPAVAFVAIAAILHFPAVTRGGASNDADSIAPFGAVLLLGATLDGQSASRGWRNLLQYMRTDGRWRTGHHSPLVCMSLSEVSDHFHRLLGIGESRFLRAPPLA